MSDKAYINMSDKAFINIYDKAFYKGCLDGARDSILFGSGAALILLSAASWFLDKSIDQDEQIEELFSRLEKCEKNHQLEK